MEFLNNSSIEDFTQSQGHGLFWDNEIREKVFKLPSCKNDTRKFDIEAIENIFNSVENISIKTSGNNNIDCGDILRFYDENNFNNFYTIILVRYKQIDEYKEIKQILELNYTLELRNYLFGDVPMLELEQYIELIKSIPFGEVSPEIKKKYKEIKKKIQEKYKMNINISPKVDSKKQRRVQCSIKKLDELLTQFPYLILNYSTIPVVRNVPITPKIYSPPRKTHKNNRDFL